MNTETQQTGKYKLALCEMCGAAFAYKIKRSRYLCPSCTKIDYAQRSYSPAMVRKERKKAKEEMLNRLTERDRTCIKPVITKRVVGQRLIETRGNNVISPNLGIRTSCPIY